MRVALTAVLLASGLPCLAAAEERPAVADTVTRTGKERLGDKAADEQRVDDCKVPRPGAHARGRQPAQGTRAIDVRGGSIA